jgi:formylglycine-generating enzyme required for sulfatase activity
MSALKRSAVASILLAGLAMTPLSAAVFQRGDANADGTVNISDAISVLGFLFLGWQEALPCADAGDVDDSGALNITDPVYLLGFLFLGGPAPPAPHGKCGPDPTADALDCAAFPPCPQKPGNPVIEGFDPLGENEQGYPEYRHLATGLSFVLLPGGTFLMGSPEDEPGRQSDEGPVHEVELSPFLIAKYEVTREVWERVMGSNPEAVTRGSTPEFVSWNDAQAFCQRTGLKLPTEAQWEYAARAGTRTAFYNGPITQLSCKPLDPLLDAIGWYCGNSFSGNFPVSQPVGEKAPNAFGLHDMAGNAWEWCEDVYDDAFYSRPAAMMKDPLATAGSGFRVFRGGSWRSGALQCRSAYRFRDVASIRFPGLGFRPALFPLP